MASNAVQEAGRDHDVQGAVDSELVHLPSPRLGSRPIAEITAPELLAVLRSIESRGMNETAHRALQRFSQVFRYAIATGRATRDITSDLRGALAPVVVENRAAITEQQRIAALPRSIDGYIGHPTTAIALKPSPLVFVRPSELRAAKWSEIDLNAAEWRIPAERMKMRERHIVQLSTQAVGLLRQLRSIARKSRYVFPSLQSRDRPMSVNTVNGALRRLGYARDEMTAHGFRAMACTCLNELGWHPDLIELQLAHAERNKVRAAYNRAERLADRRKMMQAWGGGLSGWAAGGPAQDHRDPNPITSAVSAIARPDQSAEYRAKRRRNAGWNRSADGAILIVGMMWTCYVRDPTG